MKKILLATTILVGFGGAASAEVALSGDARMGILNDGTDSAFTSRARVTFTASGETDGGLSFGASFRADNAGAAAGGTAGSVFVSGSFGKLSMGDVDSAFGATFGQIGGVGLTGLGDLNEISHSADGGGFSGLNPLLATGVVREGGYNALFTLSADKTEYTSTTGKVLGFGQAADTLWGDLFDYDAFVAEVNTAGPGPNSVLADTDLVANVALDGTVTDANLSEANFDGAIQLALLDSVVTLAKEADLLSAGITTADVASVFVDGGANPTLGAIANFGEIEDFFGNLDAYYVNTPNKALLLSGALPAEDNYVDLNVSTAGVAAIPAKVLYEYAAGDFQVSAGYSQLGSNEAYSFAGAYTISGVKLSAGIARADWNDAIKASMTVSGLLTNELANGDNIRSSATATVTHDLTANDLNLGASYTVDALTLAGVWQRKTFELNNTQVDEITSAGISVGYTMDAISLSAFAKSAESDVSGDTSVYGLGASYDLGGGAKVVGGLVGGDVDTAYDLGLSFTF